MKVIWPVIILCFMLAALLAMALQQISNHMEHGGHPNFDQRIDSLEASFRNEVTERTDDRYTATQAATHARQSDLFHRQVSASLAAIEKKNRELERRIEALEEQLP